MCLRSCPISEVRERSPHMNQARKGSINCGVTFALSVSSLQVLLVLNGYGTRVPVVLFG